MASAVDEVEKVLNNLNQITVQLDDDFHELIEVEEHTEAELKEELHEDEEMLQLTNKGLKIVEQLEKIEKNLNQHVRAAESGQSHEQMEEILGHSLGEIEKDINNLGNLLDNISHQIGQFKSDSVKTANEVNTFKDIEEHIEKGQDKTTELARKLEDIQESDYTNPPTA